MRRALALGTALIPGTASAHTVPTGLGAFHDGAAHVAAAPEALLAVIALRPAWSRVAVRAAGAWIAAFGTMTAAWVSSSAANATPS